MMPSDVVFRSFEIKAQRVQGREYDWIGSEYIHGLTPVWKNEGNAFGYLEMGFADKTGKVVIPINYDLDMALPYSKYSFLITTCSIGSNDYLFLSQLFKYGLLRLDGSVFVDFVWEDLCYDTLRLADISFNSPFYQVLSSYLTPISRGKKWGLLDLKTGKPRVEPVYKVLYVNDDETITVYLDHKEGTLDKNGNLISEMTYMPETDTSELDLLSIFKPCE